MSARNKDLMIKDLNIVFPCCMAVDGDSWDRTGRSDIIWFTGEEIYIDLLDDCPINNFLIRNGWYIEPYDYATFLAYKI